MIVFVLSYYMLISRNTLRLIVQYQYVLISQKSCVPVTEPLRYVLLLLLLTLKTLTKAKHLFNVEFLQKYGLLCTF